MRKVIFAVLITIVLVGSVLVIDHHMRHKDISPNQAEAGKTLPPELSVTALASKKVYELKSFSGKVVLINFWASWCEACMAEMPSIQKIYETLKGDGFEVLAVNVDENPEKVVPAIVEKLHLTFPIYVEKSGELSKAFDVVAIPFNVIADRNQKIVWSESGERDWSSAEIIGDIRKLLKPI